MSEDVRTRAKKKVAAKKTFYTVAVVFTGAALILITLSFILPEISQWLLLALPALALVLGVLYLDAFGYPGADRNAEDWEEAEIRKEMKKIELQRSARTTAPPPADRLELEDVERIEVRLPNEDDLV